MSGKIDELFLWYVVTRKKNIGGEFWIRDVSAGDGILEICEAAGLQWFSGSKPTKYVPMLPLFHLRIRDGKLTFSSQFFSNDNNNKKIDVRTQKNFLTADECKKFAREYEELDEKIKQRLRLCMNL